VVDAVRASISIPGILEPVRMGNRWLIDGGVLDPVPVDFLSREGVHKIIAVNTLPSPAKLQGRQAEVAREAALAHKEALAAGGLQTLLFKLRRAWWAWRDPNILDVLVHTMQAMEYELAEVGCAQADVALHPTLGRVNWWEFYNVGMLIEKGIQETRQYLPEIKRLIRE
jgi:predicted acylesterase/phospholipase RssA